MGKQALGAYIQELAKRRGLTIATVTSEAGVKTNYIWRLINEDGEPSATLVARLIQAVRGDFNQAMQLLLDEDADIKAGAEVAQNESEDALDRILADIRANPRLLKNSPTELIRFLDLIYEGVPVDDAKQIVKNQQ